MSTDDQGQIGRADVAEWHLARNRQQYGPYNFATLREAVKNDVLSRDDLVWRPGWEAWRPAHSVAGLFAAPELDVQGAVSSERATPRTENNIPALTKTESTAHTVEHAAQGDDPEGREQSPPRRNYFIRHWRGELSLAVSYWINGILSALAAYIAVLVLGAVVDGNQLAAGAPIALALVGFLVVIVLLSTWQMVGIWRSASRHAAAGKRFWAGVAKAAVIIGVVRILVDVGSTFLPIISEHIRIAMGDQRFGENRFRLLRDGSELEFSGGINIGTAKEFNRMLEAASQVHVLHLNSSGGRVSEANLIAAEVRKRSLITYVSERCDSACTHIFMAGRERWLSTRGKLGFHQPSFPGLDKESAAGMIEAERRDLESMGLPSNFISKAIGTPNDQIWRPTHDELLAARAISGISDGSRFAASGTVASLPTAELEKMILKIPLYAALKRVEPSAFEEMMTRLAEGYRRGASEEEIISGARTIVLKSIRRQLPYASDRDLLQSVDIIIAYMEGLKSVDPESCVAIEDDSRGARLRSNLVKLFPEISARELLIGQAIIESSAFGKSPPPTDEQVEPFLEKVRGKLARRSEWKAGLIDKAKLAPEEFKPFCETALAFYQEIRRLPAREATAVLRNIYADAGK